MYRIAAQFAVMSVLVGLLCATVVSVARGGPSRAHLEAPKLVTVTGNEASVRDVLKEMFNQEGVSYSLGPNVQGRVTLALANVPLSTALGYACKTCGLTCQLKGGVYDVEAKPGPLPVEDAPPVQISSQQIPSVPYSSVPDPGLPTPSAMAVDDSFVYVLRGKHLYKVSKTDLHVLMTGDLPALGGFGRG